MFLKQFVFKYFVYNSFGYYLIKHLRSLSGLVEYQKLPCLDFKTMLDDSKQKLFDFDLISLSPPPMLVVF